MASDIRPTHDECALDETIAETFPASDAPANTPETGVRISGPLPNDIAESIEVVDGRPADRRP